MSKISYIAFGNEELKNQPEVKKGMEIICPQCGQLHKINLAKGVDRGEETTSLCSYNCSTTGKMYLAGVNGKLIIGVKK